MKEYIDHHLFQAGQITKTYQFTNTLKWYLDCYPFQAGNIKKNVILLTLWNDILIIISPKLVIWQKSSYIYHFWKHHIFWSNFQSTKSNLYAKPFPNFHKKLTFRVMCFPLMEVIFEFWIQITISFDVFLTAEMTNESKINILK